MPELSLSNFETVQIHAQTLWHWSLFKMYVSLQKLKVVLIIHLRDTCM